MTEIRLNGLRQHAGPGSRAGALTAERLRTIIQDSHPNYLIGAGTCSRTGGLRTGPNGPELHCHLGR